MTPYSRLFWPTGLLMLVLAGATLFFGADTVMTSLLFATAILLMAGAALMMARTIVLPKLVLIILPVLLLFFLAGMISGGLIISGPDFAVLAAAVAVFLLAHGAARNAAQISPLWNVMLLVFLLIGMWAFADFIVNPENIHGRLRPYHEDRLSAAFLSANTAATFFGMVLIAAAASILRALTKIGSFHFFTLLEGLFRHALVGLLTFMFAGICLLLTASRAGLAFAALSLLILIIWEVIAFRRKEVAENHLSLLKIVGAIIIVLVMLGVGFWVLSGDVAGARYAELDDDANMRLVMYSAYWEAFLQRPFFGYGLGSFDQMNNSIMTGANAHILATQGAAHNVILQWLVQTGLVGTMTMLGFMAAIFVNIWRGLTRRRRYRTYLRATLVISVFIVLHSMVDYAVEIPGFMWWWAFVLGLASGVADGETGAKTRERSGQISASGKESRMAG